MQLIVEVGNTNTKLAVFEKNNCIEKAIWKNAQIEDVEKFCINVASKVDKTLLSYTGIVNERLYNMLKDNFLLYEFNANSKLSVQNKYATPATLGKDRLAAIVGVWELYPKQASMHISAGTCITYDAVDKEGVYYGGSISPGLTMRFKALQHFTARLPLVEAASTEKWYGDSTETAIRTGVQIGFLAEIRSFIDIYKRYYQIDNVILSGGDADFISKEINFPFVVEKEIVLKGLNKILTDNAL